MIGKIVGNNLFFIAVFTSTLLPTMYGMDTTKDALYNYAQEIEQEQPNLHALLRYLNQAISNGDLRASYLLTSLEKHHNRIKLRTNRTTAQATSDDIDFLKQNVLFLQLSPLWPQQITHQEYTKTWINVSVWTDPAFLSRPTTRNSTLIKRKSRNSVSIS